MIVNANRAAMLAQVKKVARAAPVAHSLKELAGILIEAEERTGVMKLTATNLIVSIRAVMPAVVERSGSAVIDARLLLGVLAKLPGENVNMELKENGQLYIGSNHSKYLIAVLDSKNYPAVEIPYPDGTIPIKGVRSLIARSVFAASAQEMGNTALNCINLIFGENGVRAVGCDGFCAVQAAGDPESKGSISLLVPAASMKLLASVAEDDAVYNVGVTGDSGSLKDIVFSDGTMIFSARLSIGNYLDTDTLFKKLVPEVTVRTDAAKLNAALDNISSLAADGGHISISFGQNSLILRCEGDSGNGSSTLDADVTLATNETYYYTYKQLANCTRTLKGNVTLNFTKDKMLEILGDNVRYFQLALKEPAKAKKDAGKPAEKPRKTAAA